MLALFIAGLLVFTGAGHAVALGNFSDDIIYESKATPSFPMFLAFELSAESDEEIEDIRLHYSTERSGFAPVTSEVYIRFTPGKTAEVEWTWDMRRTGGLPPGTVVEYWWTIKNAAGDRLDTSPETVRFDDNRYRWESLTEGNLTLYWYSGGSSFAEELMECAQRALVSLNNNTGAFLKKPAEIYIYSSSTDLKGAMIFPQDWTGGVAYTQYNAIAIGISPINLEWGKNAIAHELTHLVIHQMVSNPYLDLPAWLDEGLAMSSEEKLDTTFSTRLETAVKNDNLITVRSLSSPFSTDSDKAYLSYAQSHSIVEYLIDEYGNGKMLELLTVFSQGCGYDEALLEVYGFDMNGLNSLWLDYVRVKYGVSSTRITASPWLPEFAVSLPARPYALPI